MGVSDKGSALRAFAKNLAGSQLGALLETFKKLKSVECLKKKSF